MELSEYCKIKWERSLTLKKQRAFHEAEKELIEALDEQPDHPLLKSSLAQLYLIQDRLSEASVLAESVLALDPQYAQALYVQGEIFFKEKKLNDALLCFQHAYQKEPKPYLLLSLVKTLRELRRYQEALENLDTALTGDRDNLRFQKEKALILNRMARYEDALKIYEKIAKFDPKDAFVRKEVYRLKGMKRPDDKLIEELEKVVRLPARENDAQLHGFLGQKLQKGGKLKEAAAELRRARELEPNNPYFVKQEGFCRYKLKEYPEAMRLLGQAFRKDPNDFVVKNTLKKIYLNAGDIQGFISLLEEVLKEHPQHVKLMGTLKSLQKKVDSDHDR